MAVECRRTVGLLISRKIEKQSKKAVRKGCFFVEKIVRTKFRDTASKISHRALFRKGGEFSFLESFSDRNREFPVSGQKKSTPEDAVVSGALGGI